MTLFIVATPIGNLQDISSRAVAILSTVQLILAEDTRHSNKLLQHLGLKTPMLALHEHNEERLLVSILQKLQTEDLALISDAGTPLISDPGFKLVRFLINHNIKIVPIPGACALITALSASGLPTNNFVFIGFLPSTSSKRQTVLQALQTETKTMIFYESPRRIIATLDIMLQIFGANRLCCIARELTKLNEQIITLPIKNLIIALANGDIITKGELVVLVQGLDEKTMASNADQIETKRVLQILLNSLSIKRAVKLTSEITAGKKNSIYKMALNMQKPV